MAIEIGTAFVSIVPSARGIEGNIARELAPVSGIAAKEGTKAGKALGGNVTKGLQNSIGKLSGLAAGFGVPFANQLNLVNSRLDLTSAKGAKLQGTLSKLGGASLIAAGVGLVAVGSSAVHAADDFEISHARLETAVANTGQGFESAAPGVAKLDDAFIKLGFNAADTENALSRLTSATGNVAKAQKLMGLAADIARARNIGLTQASDLLAKASLGTFTGLRRLGIVSKEDIAGFKNLSDVTTLLTAKFGGQGAAFADTFAGKMAALKAQANQLEITIGTALIPKIQALASGTVGAVQGFEDLNRSSGGLLGKTLAIGAAIPVGVFALEKLNNIGAKVAGQYGKVGKALQLSTTATEAATVAAALAPSATVALVTAQQAEVAAALEAVAAEQALAAVQFELAQSATVDAAALTELTAASEAAAVAQANLATASAAAASASGAGVAAGATAGVGALTLEAVAVGALGVALGNVKFDQAADGMSTLGKGAFAAGKAFVDTLVPGAQALTGALGFLGFGHKKNADATKEDTVASLQNALAKAQEKLANDQLAGNTKALAGDKAAVAGINKKLSAAEQVVAEAMGTSTGAIDANAAAAEKGKFAYLGLADTVKTAADALQQISQHAFVKFDLQVSVDTDKTNVQSALDALNNPDTGGGVGGSGQTAAAKFLEQQQKDIALRDARTGQERAIQGVTDAQNDLTRAQQDQVTAADTLRTAQESYRTTLQGVARDSKAAKDATDALTQAKNDAASSEIGVREAKRNLEQAKNDKALLALDVKAARKKLAEDKAGTSGSSQFVETPTGSKQVSSGGVGADADTIKRDQIALNDAIIAQGGANDTVRTAEIALSNARLDAKQKTKDQAEAQRVLNGTLHGFGPASREAKAAQDQLTQAQNDAIAATTGVRNATNALRDAEFQTRDAALALFRAQADLDGRLEASTGASSAGKKLDSLATRANAAATAIKQLAIDAAASDQAAGHSIGHSILVEIQTLEAYAAANPLLAHAFDSALKELENRFLADLIQRQTGPSGFKVQKGQFRRASGGPVSARSSYLVGEEGPEMFVPNVSGVIVPNHHSAANSRSVVGGGDTYIINASTLEEHRIGNVVVRALQDHTNKNGFVRGVRTAG